MLQLLIVDDEIHAVEGIKSAVDWKKLGIKAVFTAFNIRQAKEVFMNNNIDIMLCDIEMPQGSGLELLAWVRENYPKTESIFLTCHADFNYAKQAIQLGSLDYILKPIPFNELEVAISKAIEKIRNDRKLMEYSQFGKFWFKHQPLLIERFWLDILNQTIPSTAKAIKKAAEDRNIPFQVQMKFLPILISVQRWHEELNLNDEKLMEFALKNSAEELILGGGENGRILELRRGALLGILSLEQNVNDSILERLRENCQAYIEACNGYFNCDLSCYIGGEAYSHELSDMVDRLLLLEKNNVAFDNKVFLLNQKTEVHMTFKIPDMSVWSVMLTEGSKDKVLAEVVRYMEEIARMGEMNANILQQFHHDFLQMVYSVLKLKGIQAHQLFNDSISMELFAHAARSVRDMTAWIRHIVEKGMKYVDAVEESQSVVDKVRKYILQNLGQELTREDIANQVFLNPDYLTRIFKKETGLSIVEYISSERIKKAKELLEKTDLPVSAVATQVGYTNFSYFAKTFKKYTDINPQDYKRKHIKGTVKE